MNMQKITRGTLIVLLILLPFVLSACNVSDLDTGSLTVLMNIPDIHPEQVELSKVVVKVTKSSTETTQTFDADEQTLEAIFEYLAIGSWEVSVTVLDSEGYTIYRGHEAVSITAGQDIPSNLTLELVPGNLEVTVASLPENVTAAKAFLEGYAGDGLDLVTNMSVKDGTATATMSNLDPMSCKLRIELYNTTGALVTTPGKKDITILPGRTTEAQFSVSILSKSIK